MLISEETQTLLEEMGYNSIDEYFSDLAEDFGLLECEVEMLADVLGESELFDGLTVACQDRSYF